MKAEIEEYGTCFSIHIEPETMQEMATLIRLGINQTTRINLYVEAHEGTTQKDARVFADFVIRSRAQKSVFIMPKR